MTVTKFQINLWSVRVFPTPIGIWSQGWLSLPPASINKTLYFLFLCGCTILVPQPPTHLYYVIDINGTEPDAEFNDRGDAKDYVEKFKEFHTYRIVKAQHFANEN